MSDTVREPKQQRSIDKKNRIIEAGYCLFEKQGYFDTNTVEIAKLAGVSTGIVYGYFRDKRDILIEVLDVYIENVYQPIFSMLDKISSPLDFRFIITHIVDTAVSAHRENAAMHETLHSLTRSDKTVGDKFTALEDEMTAKMVNRLKNLGYTRDDIYERVHLAMVIIQSYAHECVYDKHSYIDYVKMRTNIIRVLVDLME